MLSSRIPLFFRSTFPVINIGYRLFIFISVICLTNGLLLLAILHNSSFRKRKELLIIASLAGTDIFYGLGTMLYGIYRSSVLWQGRQNDYITKWDCVILPATIMSYIGGQMIAIMNVVLSLDRLRAVIWPLKYRLLNVWYALKILVSYRMICQVYMMV
jgi:hypothetical protein